jgi:hypothetical protein
MKRKSIPKKGIRKRIIFGCLTAARGHFDDDYIIEYDPEYDYILEAPPARKSNRELDSLNQILDEIAVEKLRSENYEEKGSL